ncbi:hypothetical protein CPLU01_16117 [Colletotrichum plurivorum]|nr:hypothetical protein CPLU01_16117 [Colletotrichum plurivorum]
MEVLDRDLRQFVRVWNNHRIRKQKSRPHVIPGIPYVLFHHPDQTESRDYGQVLTPELANEMQALLGHEDFDLSVYLPYDIMALCRGIMEQAPVRPNEHERINGADLPYFGSYIYLREKLESHHQAGANPHLKLQEAPLGGIQRLEDVLRGHGIQIGDELERSDDYESDWDLESEID